MKVKYWFFATIMVCAFAVSSCQKEEVVKESPKIEEVSDLLYFKQNISLFDARIRSLDESNYVREVYFLNLAEEVRMPESIVFQGAAFVDNGEYFDQVAGDGIYTSVDKFVHDQRIPYLAGQTLRSVLERPIVNEEFKHSAKLAEVAANYELRADQVEYRIFEITCDVEFGTQGCLAQQWGWCDSCCVTVYTDTCSVTVGF